MTDNEIIKALECCGSNGWGEEDKRPCDNCPMQDCEDCEVELPDYALDLVNRQKAEIERLKNHFMYAEIHNDIAIEIGAEHAIIEATKPQIIREFGKLLIDKSQNGMVPIADIPDYVKEMTEAPNDQQKT